MPAQVLIEARLYTSLLKHLLDSPNEQAAFLLARQVARGDDLLMLVDSVQLLAPSDFTFQSSFHIELAHDAVARAIQAAWRSRAVLIEVHSHVGQDPEPRFSPSDISGFQSFVPYVRWRLQELPYAAVVVTKTGFTGLVWSGPIGTDPESVSEFRSSPQPFDTENPPFSPGEMTNAL